MIKVEPLAGELIRGLRRFQDVDVVIPFEGGEVFPAVAVVTEPALQGADRSVGPSLPERSTSSLPPFQPLEPTLDAGWPTAHRDRR